MRTPFLARATRFAALAFAFAASPAYAGVFDGGCQPVENPLFEVAGAVSGAYRFQSFANTAYVQRSQETTFNLREATDTNGRRGIIGTEQFNETEMRELDRLESRIARCVIGKANIVRAFRAKRGAAAEKLGIVGIAYAYNNGTYNKNPDGSAVRGGQIVVTDLFFDRQSFDRRGTGDEQMQVAMGWSTCQPPQQLSGSALADVSARARELPAPLRRLTRERILFHEYIHGVTHEQEGDGYSDPNSVEGFFGSEGVSRFEKLRRKLFQAGGRLEQLNARLREARSREAYCAIYAERAEYLKSEGVPQRWPGDTHALDDRDEYVTILLETMAYDPEAAKAYSAEERAWAESWWNYTFNPDYRSNGRYRKLAFGDCPAGAPVSSRKRGSTTPRDAAMNYGQAVDDYFGY